MKKYYADRKSLKFLRAATFLIIACIIIALKYLLIFLKVRFPEYFDLPRITVPEIIVWAFALLLVIAYVIFLMIILPLWYRSVSYMVSSEEIVIRSGIFVRNTVCIKTSAVQYTTSVSLPLSKYTGFNFLFINAYGGRLLCYFLSSSDIEEIDKKIRQAIISRGGI